MRDNGSFSDAADHYAQVDWTPWDCCRCAAETRDAMLERVADAFGRYALIVYHHPIKVKRADCQGHRALVQAFSIWG